MLACVVGSTQDFQVFWPVVGLVAVYVMHYF